MLSKCLKFRCLLYYEHEFGNRCSLATKRKVRVISYFKSLGLRYEMTIMSLDWVSQCDTNTVLVRVHSSSMDLGTLP